MWQQQRQTAEAAAEEAAKEAAKLASAPPGQAAELARQLKDCLARKEQSPHVCRQRFGPDGTEKRALNMPRIHRHRQLQSMAMTKRAEAAKAHDFSGDRERELAPKTLRGQRYPPAWVEAVREDEIPAANESLAAAEAAAAQGWDSPMTRRVLDAYTDMKEVEYMASVIAQLMQALGMKVPEAEDCFSCARGTEGSCQNPITKECDTKTWKNGICRPPLEPCTAHGAPPRPLLQYDPWTGQRLQTVGEIFRAAHPAFVEREHLPRTPSRVVSRRRSARPRRSTARNSPRRPGSAAAALGPGNPIRSKRRPLKAPRSLPRSTRRSRARPRSVRAASSAPVRGEVQRRSTRKRAPLAIAPGAVVVRRRRPPGRQRLHVLEPAPPSDSSSVLEVRSDGGFDAAPDVDMPVIKTPQSSRKRKPRIQRA